MPLWVFLLQYLRVPQIGTLFASGMCYLSLVIHFLDSPKSIKCKVSWSSIGPNVILSGLTSLCNSP